MKNKRACELCGGVVGPNRHAGGGKLCSKKCELELVEISKIKELEFLKEGINALSFKKFAKRDGPYRRVVIIGDTHFPFHCQRTHKKIFSFIEKFKPLFIIQIGDLYDFFSQSKYPKSLNVMTPRDEIKKGREEAEKFWAEIHRAAPHAKKIQIKGNHDDRPYKRLLEKAPELEPFFEIDHLFEFAQVETVHDSKQELVIDGVCYQHGFTKHGEHMRRNLMSSVHGHTHRPGVFYMKLRNELIWELDAGLTADITNSSVMGYGQTRWNQCALGLALIDELGPRFIAESEL